MMQSTTGCSLTEQKKTTQMSLNIKACKNIASSASTLFEKLSYDKKSVETEEETAIYNMLLLIKQIIEN